ncbi:MAG TPA: hypothetical protein VHF26_11030 [Trebonia sp.]|nr:hypothetical protein [Trebonia sp.]
MTVRTKTAGLNGPPPSPEVAWRDTVERAPMTTFRGPANGGIYGSGVDVRAVSQSGGVQWSALQDTARLGLPGTVVVRTEAAAAVEPAAGAPAEGPPRAHPLSASGTTTAAASTGTAFTGAFPGRRGVLRR